MPTPTDNPTDAQAKVLAVLETGKKAFGGYSPGHGSIDDYYAPPYGFSGGSDVRLTKPTGRVLHKRGWVEFSYAKYPSSYWVISDSGRAALRRWREQQEKTQ